MTEHRTLNTVIHRAFRRDLRRFDDALGAFPAGSQQRADELGVAWDNLAFQLHHHHDDEETIFWPALRELGADPSTFAELESEHERMLGAVDVADAAMRDLRAAPTDANAAAAHRSIAGLSEVLVAHLDHEERDLEPFAAQQESTPQMRSAKSAVSKSHKGHTGVFVAWLLDDADAGTRAAVRHEIPAPVVTVLVHTSGRKYGRTVAAAWA